MNNDNATVVMDNDKYGDAFVSLHIDDSRAYLCTNGGERDIDVSAAEMDSMSPCISVATAAAALGASIGQLLLVLRAAHPERDFAGDDPDAYRSNAELAFRHLAHDVGSDPITEENAILSAGREFLPAFAVAVLDGGEATDEYWDWLAEQTELAQAEHEREVAAGHEWHA